MKVEAGGFASHQLRQYPGLARPCGASEQKRHVTKATEMAQCLQCMMAHGIGKKRRFHSQRIGTQTITLL
jgi:hypothetical protein